MKTTKRLLAIVLAAAVLTAACADDNPPDRNPHYVAVENALKGCTFAQCHANGGVGDRAAMFPLGAAIAAGDFRTALVNVPSCEYDVMARVTPGDPDNSWLMVKLTADYVMTGLDEGRLIFTPDPTWTEADKCNPAIPGFGKRMPDTSPFSLADAPLNAIRTWIDVGAPGPNDPVADAGL